MPAPTVALPERLGRRMSLGPFEDPRDLLRFLLCAALGVLVAAGWGLWGAVPFLLAGACLTLVRKDGEVLWVVADRRLRYLLRRRSGRLSFPPPWPPRGRVLGGRYFDVTGHPWELWEASPSAYSGRTGPSLLEEAGSLLRALASYEQEAILYRIPEAWDATPYLAPLRGKDPTLDMEAEGYRQLLREVTKGRMRSRLFLAVPCPLRTPNERSARDRPETEVRSPRIAEWHRVPFEVLQRRAPELCHAQRAFASGT